MQSINRLIFPMVAAGLSLGCGSTGFATGRDAATVEQRQALVHNGITRTYVVRTPSAMPSRNVRIPLVLVLHGGGGNAFNAERMTGFTKQAKTRGFIVAYPEGTGRFNGKLLTWNAGHCCGYAMKNRTKDVDFIGTLIDKLIAEYPIDPRRVYVTGMSNGGMMAHRLGIELAHKLAAIAPVVATVFGDEVRPRHPVSAIMINGMLDESVPYQGGPSGGRFADAWDGVPARPALEQAGFWANVNGCGKEPAKLDRGRYVLWRYRCPAGRAVEIYLVKDNGHAWPGGQKGSRRGDAPSSALSATEVIWEFFETHGK